MQCVDVHVNERIRHDADTRVRVSMQQYLLLCVCMMYTCSENSGHDTIVECVCACSVYVFVCVSTLYMCAHNSSGRIIEHNMHTYITYTYMYTVFHMFEVRTVKPANSSAGHK